MSKKIKQSKCKRIRVTRKRVRAGEEKSKRRGGKEERGRVKG